MPITELLARNARLYADEPSLIEVNPEIKEKREVTWREFELVETKASATHRREMTWREFDDMASRFANLLLGKDIKKGDKVALLLMNCLEWLPLYFGILRAGAVAVPLNYRYTAEEIKYCLQLSEADMLIFGPEFIGRVETICDQVPRVRERIFVGADCPSFAESYDQLAADCGATAPPVMITDADDAALYFSSGTTGFPKAILHTHRSLTASCITEQDHHGQTRDDNFLCIPPLYHTGAKMHWFGSLLAGSRAVLLRGVSPRVDTGDGFRGTGHDRLAARPLGPGHSRRDRKRRDQAGRLCPAPVAADAYRGPAGASQPDPPLEKIFSQPPLRYQLRPDGVERPRLCPSRRRQCSQGRGHRQARTWLGGDDRRRGGVSRPAGRGRRTGRQGTGHDEMLL